MEVGEREIIYLSLHCRYTFCQEASPGGSHSNHVWRRWDCLLTLIGPMAGTPAIEDTPTANG